MASKHGGLVLGADQAHTNGILAALNKLKGIEDLTNNNFISWHKQVIGQLSTIHFDPYLSDVIQQVIQPTDEELEANPNARPHTTGRLVPEFLKGPANLWRIIKDYHQSDNEASLYLIQSKLNNFQQDYKTSITTHLDVFTKLKHELVNRGGHVNESHLGQLLLHSLDNSHIAEVKYIPNNLKPITSRGVIQPLKSYKDNNSNFGVSAKSKNTNTINNLKLAGNTFKPNTLKPKCTPTNYLGPHPAAECSKKPENRKSEREWF
ncbi:hypothetical protein PSTG_17424 [Puccinia striiformis f. sp. tritici PST-78]|uniref:Uncharacterized protein n=1 Tax=Puccinia striiformis f. sp. tritici PST-78 TaxID=1165861 RepID=A0A0L0UQ18_9BASI|nr:hypothetical protein PSTG_17424 [Puccinia striiformis f. sp. tritici PST-78]